MTKSELMGHFDEIDSAGLRIADLIPFAIAQERSGSLDLCDGRYSFGLSSETYGNKGITELTKDEMEMYSCLLWVRCGIPDHIRKRRILFLMRINSPAFVEVTVFGLTMAHADYTHRPEELRALINERELNILAGPPSLLSMIAQHQHAIPTRIETLICYAEVLTDKTRAALESAFGALVVQICQGPEGFIGSACRCGKLHLNEDIALVELCDVDDRIGDAKKVILTDMYRTTLPFVRYSLNDIVEISPELCECGSCFRVI